MDVTTKQLYQKVNDLQEKLTELETDQYDKDQKSDGEAKRYALKEKNLLT